MSNSFAGRVHRVDRILQLPRHRIPRGQGKQLRLVGFDELGQDAARGGELDVQKRRILLRGGEKDELPVGAVGVEVEVIVQLIPDLGRIAGEVDVEIGEGGRLAGKVLERAVVAFDKGGGGDLDQVPEHEAVGDEAFHGNFLRFARSFCLIKNSINMFS
jgi:hypothetical protein